MKTPSLFEQILYYLNQYKIVIAILVVIWGIVLFMVVAGILLLEKPSVAQQPDSSPSPIPVSSILGIIIEPDSGQVGTIVNVQGQGWLPGQTITLYLMPIGQTVSLDYAISTVVADEQGRFTSNIIIPALSGSMDQGAMTILARIGDDPIVAQAIFNLVDQPISATETPSLPTEPPQSPAEVALATISVDLNVRSGPSTSYPALGLIKTGQTAPIIGISPDGRWWQISFAGTVNGRGWVSGDYVVVQHTNNVPVVQPEPPLTPQSQPASATPVIITDWRGEYYNNINLSGTPTVVRNDVLVDFKWGGGPPTNGISADNFSARWTRTRGFDAGLYRFYATVDDGVRLYVDNSLVIDAWYNGGQRQVSGDIGLAAGTHSLRLEYYERTGDASIQLWWEKVVFAPTATSTGTATPTPTPTVTGTATPTTTATPTVTPSPTICPQATPEPLWVDPVLSPTDGAIQTVVVYLGSGEEAVITTESGTFTATGDFNATSNPALIDVTLLPDTTHHLTVVGKVKSSTVNGCPFGGYTLSTQLDRNAQPLIIVQQTEN